MNDDIDDSEQSNRDNRALQEVPRTRPYNNILSVPFIAMHLAKGYSQASIARIAGVDPNSVYMFIKRHKDELDMLNHGDELLRYKIDYKNHKLIDGITDDALDKVHPYQKYLMMGIGIEKSQLLQGKPTQNVAIGQVTARRKEIEVEMAELEDEIKYLEAPSLEAPFMSEEPFIEAPLIETAE